MTFARGVLVGGGSRGQPYMAGSSFVCPLLLTSSFLAAPVHVQSWLQINRRQSTDLFSLSEVLSDQGEPSLDAVSSADFKLQQKRRLF